MERKRKSKALCIQPPVYDFAFYDMYVRPYGLYRIAGWLSQGGYETEILDCLDWREPETVRVKGKPKRSSRGTGKVQTEEVPFPCRKELSFRRKYRRYGILPSVITRRILASQADLICITSGMTYWYPGLWEIIDMVRSLLPSVPVLIGGIYATLMPEHLSYRYPEVHILPGSDEGKLRLLLDELSLPVPGAAFPVFPPAAGCDWRGAGVIRLNRGCPLHCNYCASGLLDSCFEQGDPEQAVDWLLSLYREREISTIAFYDDALLIRKEEVFVPFLEKILSSQAEFRFFTPNGLHVQGIDRNTAELMKQAGFQEIRLGFESSSEQFHTAHDNKSSRSSFASCLDALKSGGFDASQLRVYVLAGLPGQKREEVEESVRFASACGTVVSVAEYTPVPGTALWEPSCRESAYPLESEPLFHNNTLHPLQWEGFTREDMQRVKLLARDANRRLLGT